MNVYDLTLISDDLAISGGDFGIGESTLEHQQQLLINGPGSFKDNPSACIGAQTYLDDDNTAGLLEAIAQGFTADGMTVANVSLTNVEASY